MNPTAIILVGLAAYAAVGVLVGVAFVLLRATAAAGGGDVPLRVRLLLLPGAVAVWPALVGSLIGGRAGGRSKDGGS